MNFKESYKKDCEAVKPDEAFKKQLSEEMNAELSHGKRGKMSIVIFAAAAAAAFIAAGIRFIPFEANRSGLIYEQADTFTTMSTCFFEREKWYLGAETDEEIWQKFRELTGGAELVSIYCGSSEKLEDGDILSDFEVKELSRRLSAAVPCESENLSGEINFCMAVFGDGKIVKFRISENGEVQLNDSEMICKIE